MSANIKYRLIHRCVLPCAAIVFCFLFALPSTYGQHKDSITRGFLPHYDSVLSARIRKEGEDEARKSLQQFNSTRAARKQEEILEELKKTTQKAKDFINSGVDTREVSEQLNGLKRWLLIAEDGVLRNTDSVQTYRNLTATAKLLAELYHTGNARKTELDNYEKGLFGYRYKMDSLYSDSVLYSFSQDSAVLVPYLQKIIAATRDIGPADTLLSKAISRVTALQADLNLFVNNLELYIEVVEDYQTKLSSAILHREFNHFDGTDRTFGQILTFSRAKARLNFWFFVRNNPGRIFLIIFLIIAATVFLNSLKQKLKSGDIDTSDLSGYFVLRYPFFSAVVIVLCIFQFIFSEPPFVFSCILWIIASLSLSFIFWKSVKSILINGWMTMLIIFFLACGDNLILQASRVERIGLLVFSVIGIVSSLYFLQRHVRNVLREKYLMWFLILVVVFETGSLIANLSGRYNLSKSLFISGYSNMIIGILFLWTIRLINEGLTIAARLYTGQERKLFYVNFDRVGGKVPMLVNFSLILGWLILIGRNFYAFKFISAPFNYFFFAERTIGSFTFTFEKIFIFFIIISISVVISRIVSFFASDRQMSHGPGSKEKPTGIGSWLLLIRVAIITSGLLLALAASGFPMDRITIILGALGVGIGFGLQSLVHNLVSGVIIAFEKPVNVGDIVEIAGQTGTMKSIGFRSSVISKSEGADVVIPNGELLNTHLINWTHGGNKRRMEISVGITHGSDHQKIRQMLAVIMDSNTQILKYPKPDIIFSEITGIRIDIRIQFWVGDIRNAAIIRSDAISAIDLAFKNNGVVVPVSPQELYLYSFPRGADTGKKL